LHICTKIPPWLPEGPLSLLGQGAPGGPHTRVTSLLWLDFYKLRLQTLARFLLAPCGGFLIALDFS
jgi:hypothetical protein